MNYKLYEVGGHVRDSILGIQSKDIDYSVVIESDFGADCVNGICIPVEIQYTPQEAFKLFVQTIKEQGFTVFLETKDCLTVRAKTPFGNLVADFVIARKEEYPNQFSRTPVVSLGTLRDDLERRDFTLNAIARDGRGELIDPFNGFTDLMNNILRTPKDAVITLNEDPLRVLRAIRFRVTRGFDFSDSLLNAIETYPVERLSLVSTERVREEMYKCFAHDTKKTLQLLNFFNRSNFKIHDYLFDTAGLWLKPTNEQR